MNAIPFEKIKMVIFDWAGTIIDFGCQAPLIAFVETFKQYGLEVTPDEIIQFMGMGKYEHIAAILDLPTVNIQLSEEDLMDKKACVYKLYKIFQEQLDIEIPNHIDLVPGLNSVVEYLNKVNIQIGSTSGYTSDMLWKIVNFSVKQDGDMINNFTKPCVASDDVPKSRPGPSMIYQCIANSGLNLRTNEVVKVGDTVADIQEGRNAGCWTIGVIDSSSLMGLSYEASQKMDPEQLNERRQRIGKIYMDAGADFVINDLSELHEILSCLVANYKF